MLLLTSGVSAQELTGKVTEGDSSATVLYQAIVTQSQNGTPIATCKTFFDGSYHLKVKPGQTYQVKASYPGRKDSTVTIMVDKKGTLYAGSLFFSLQKNGLRLMGYVMDRDEDIPIKDAGILLRNVMTRKEDKYFTDVNGYYNLKMDFETNYTFKIDKRSPGIINKYQDTSFNISTIGFNQPLDFKLDIKLGPVEGYIKPRQGYDPYAAPDNKNLKPVVEVIGKRDSVKQREQAALLADLDKKLNDKDVAISSLDKKLTEISQSKKDEKTVLNDDQTKKAADAKKLEEEKAAAELKAKQQAAKEQQEKDAAEKLRKEQLAEAKRKEEEKAAADLKAKQLADKAAADLKIKQLSDKIAVDLKAKQQAEKEQQEMEAAEKLRKEQLAEVKRKEDEKAAADLKAKQLADKAAADLKAKQEQEAAEKLRKDQLAEAKKKEEEKTAADLKTKQLAEKKEKEKTADAAATQKEVDAEKLKKLVEEEHKRQAEAKKNSDGRATTDRKNGQQSEAELLAIAEKIARDNAAALKAKREKQLAAQQYTTDSARKAESDRLVKEEQERKKQLADAKQTQKAAEETKMEADARLVKQELERKKKLAADQKQKAEQEKIDREALALARADSALLADKQRKEQKERDLAAMKKAREEAEAKAVIEKRDKEANDKLAKKESKRLARELAEQNKLHKKDTEEAKRKLEGQQRLAKLKAEEEAELHKLEAKKTQEEQEKKALIQQRDKLLHDNQVRVANNSQNTSAKPVQGDNAPANIVVLNNAQAAVSKKIKAKGFVKNGQTEDAIPNVSINIRRLNSIVSQEVTTDEKGAYEFTVDSGYYYLVSFYKDKYDISKQILDLLSYGKTDYRMMIQYLNEQDDFDPEAKMPVIQFQKNSSKVPDGLWSDFEPIVKMMHDIPTLKMKLYGLASADEDYPMELSVTRARLVADMMMESGVKPSRLRINGIGPFRPRSGCVEGKSCTQDQYKMDRVVMYKVIKE